MLLLAFTFIPPVDLRHSLPHMTTLGQRCLPRSDYLVEFPDVFPNASKYILAAPILATSTPTSCVLGVRLGHQSTTPMTQDTRRYVLVPLRSLIPIQYNSVLMSRPATQTAYNSTVLVQDGQRHHRVFPVVILRHCVSNTRSPNYRARL